MGIREALASNPYDFPTPPDSSLRDTVERHGEQSKAQQTGNPIVEHRSGRRERLRGGTCFVEPDQALENAKVEGECAMAEDLGIKAPAEEAIPQPDEVDTQEPALEASGGTRRIIANVYQLSGAIYHTGLQVGDQEYNFGLEGVWASQPRECGIPGMLYIRSIEMGVLRLTNDQLKSRLEQHDKVWSTGCYDVCGRNCHDYANSLSLALGGHELPGWINGLAHSVTYISSFLGLAPTGVFSRADSKQWGRACEGDLDGNVLRQPSRRSCAGLLAPCHDRGNLDNNAQQRESSRPCARRSVGIGLRFVLGDP